jgi:hypothetical protein
MNTEKQVLIYKKITESNTDDLKRVEQTKDLSKVLDEHFKFDTIECIETGASQNFSDGCFGFFLCELIKEYGGTFKSVDINESLLNSSIALYNKFYPNLNIEHYKMDSIKFLQEYNGTPNLVHLDSWDLDLKNPVPSMLHGWLEFEAIRHKMPSGSICVIDDNFFKGTWVEWNYLYNDNVINKEVININYEIVGKGSLIYHYCKNYESDWEIVGDHYKIGPNVKVIIKKK